LGFWNGIFKKTEEPEEKPIPETRPLPATGLTPEQVEPKSAETMATAGATPAAGDTSEPEAGVGFLGRLLTGLVKTRQNISGKFNGLIRRNRFLDEDFYEELEEILIQADIGVHTALDLVEKIRKNAVKQKLTESGQIMQVIREEIIQLLRQQENADLNLSHPPAVILVVGVNGSGKTTSIAKLGYHLKQQGKQVLLVAGDTFRAAAIDQLQIWADRTGLPLIKREEGADPGAVIYDAVKAAGKYDVIIIDTAGRLQNKMNLMLEIAKLSKIISRDIPSAPHEVLLVLDATTGQNALVQARQFMEATGISGIVLTKLDGTAKGGIVMAIANELKVPVKFIGVGEAIDDIQVFNPEEFVDALLKEEEK
jgi:fused signal recognition particle receptor